MFKANIKRTEGEIDNNTIIEGFDAPLSILDRSSRQ